MEKEGRGNGFLKIKEKEKVKQTVEIVVQREIQYTYSLYHQLFSYTTLYILPINPHSLVPSLLILPHFSHASLPLDFFLPLTDLTSTLSIVYNNLI